MKKIFISMILALSLMSSLVIPAVNESGKTVPDDVIEAIEKVVSTIAFEKENYGFADVDLSKIQIGEIIPTYTLLEDKSVQATAETFYSILDEFDNLIALAVVFSDEENGTYAFVSPELVPALNACLGTDENVALVYDDKGVYCWNGTSATLLNHNTVEDVEGRASLSDVPTAALSIVETNQVESVCELGIDLDIPNTIGYDDEAVYLNVPLKAQPAGSNWCWAACMASIIQFETNKNYTTKDIGYKFKNGPADGAKITEVQGWFKNYFLSYNLHASQDYQKNYLTIFNLLGRRHPIHGDFMRKDYQSRHAAVIRGINCASKVFSIMDPTSGKYCSGQIENAKGNNGMFSFYSTGNGMKFILDQYLYQ